MKSVNRADSMKAGAKSASVDGGHQERWDMPKYVPPNGADSTNPKFQWKLSAREAGHLKLRLGNQAFLRFLPNLNSRSVVADIGSGDGFYSDIMERHGHVVHRIDAKHGRHYETTPWRPYSAIWCCHTLEHMRNPGTSLDKMFSECEVQGLVGITVPPLKHSIVGGHVSLWNAGLLIYQMVLSGFDCRAAYLGTYGYNISLIVTKVPCKVDGLIHDNGDINKVRKFFPVPFREGSDGRIGDVNWQT